MGNLSNKAQDMIIFIYVCCKDIGQDTMESNKAVMGDSGRDNELKRSRKTDRA